MEAEGSLLYSELPPPAVPSWATRIHLNLSHFFQNSFATKSYPHLNPLAFSLTYWVNRGERTGNRTSLLTPWCRVLLEKLTGLQLVKKFPAFHGTPRFITALTSVLHLSLSWASPIQSIYPQPTSWSSILISSTHLRLGLPSGLFPSDFPSKTLYTPLSSPIRATIPAHLILLDFITRTILGEGVEISWKEISCKKQKENNSVRNADNLSVKLVTNW